MKSISINKPLAVVSLTVFLDMLGFGILVPLVPLMIMEPYSAYSILSPQFGHQIRFAILGILIAMFPLFQLFSTPILGDISDTIGRKKVLFFSVAGTLFSYILLIFSIFTKNLPLLLIARAIDGITGGNLSVAQAVIADISTPQTRARNFAVLSAFFGLGFVLGPVAGAYFTKHMFSRYFGLFAPFWLAALLSAINLCAIFFLLPETRKKSLKRAVIRWRQSLKHIRSATQMKGIRLFFAVNFLLQGSFSILTTFFSVFVIGRMGFSNGQLGFILSYLGIWIAIGQLTLTKFFIHKFGELKSFYICLLGLSISILCAFLPRNFQLFLVVTPFISIFLGLSQTFLLSLVSGSVSNSKQGEVLGINNSVTALAQTIPPVVGGIGAAILSPGTPIVFAAIGSFIAALLIFRRARAIL